MELKDFIKSAICSISEGILEAQTELKDKNTIVNPEKLETGSKGDKLLRSDGWRYIQELDFEILISIDDKNGTAGGGKLTVLDIVKLGMDANNEHRVTNTNKLRFKIPVAFPTTDTPIKYLPKSQKK